MKFGTYRYYAQEWATFMKLVKDSSTPFCDLERAFKGLTHLWLKTDEPTDIGDKMNFQKSIEIASWRLEEREVMDEI